MRQPPLPLLRLSAGTGGPGDFPKNERQLAPWVDQYTSSVRTSSVPPVTPHSAPHCNNNTPSPLVPVLAVPLHHTRRSRSSSSSGAPLFSSINMFRMGTKSRSPPRPASAMYSTAPTSAPSMKPSSPTSSMVALDPLQRPFSPWGSSESQSSTSPQNTTRISKGGFNKRTGSPTASVGTSNTGSSKMSTRSKSFLTRGRKNLQSNPNENIEFDPTTFRKNRTRPARGLKGQDALYGEYEDLFDDSLDEDINEDSLPSDGNEDEDGFLLLRLEVEEGRISPRTGYAPRSVPMPNDMRQSGSNSHTPPIPPPKLWTRKSLDVTTPPRSAAASVDESLGVPDAALYDAPPTPPPKPKLFVLDTSLTSTEEPEEIHVASPGPPPPRPPPATPDDDEKRFNKRLSKLEEFPTSAPEGLGIINIPSPTLFHSSFLPGASDTWTESPSHATKSPALTSRSYTPRQPSYETNPADDDFIPKGMSLLFDETDGLGVLPLFFSKDTTTDYETSSRGSTEMTQVSLDELPTENRGDVSASTDNSGDTLMETVVEATDTFKEVNPRVAEDDNDAKEGAPVLSVTEGDDVAKSNGAVAKPEESKSTPATKDSEGQTPTPEKEEDDTKDSSYLRAFRAFVKGSGDLDPFVHRMPRFDALQAQRICSHLRKDYPLIAGANKRKSSTPKVPGARQKEVGEEILTSLWALMALRWMNFGRVVISPGHETLLAASAKRLTRRATTKMDPRATQMLENVMVEVSVADHERRRVLDLGGLPIADWGWHCAYDYPKAKVYTVTTRTPANSTGEDSEQQDTPPSADKYRGPKNHRHLQVSNLWRLPFPPNHFDVVSARTIYLTLKTTSPFRSSEQTQDEYDLCLEECLRVLKPGGHLEFSLFDNDIINAGPLGADLSEKFGESLLSKGYDPAPTKKWVSRLNRAGFGEIKRTWLFLPMAPPSSKPKVPSKGDMHLPQHESQDLEMVKEEVRRKMEAWEDVGAKKGSLENAAPITGLIGSWIWEKWMLKTSTEAGEGEWQLAVDTVGQVLSEAKEKGSGWRSLVGWARKPLHVGQH